MQRLVVELFILLYFLTSLKFNRQIRSNAKQNGSGNSRNHHFPVTQMCDMCSVRLADKEETRIINAVFFSES
jgi:hypothetical protein